MYDGLNSNKVINEFFIDITKVFDSLDHNILMNKLLRDRVIWFMIGFKII